MLQRMPYDNPDGLVLVWEQSPQTGKTHVVNPVNFLEWRARNHSFENIAALVQWPASLTGDGDPEQVDAIAVSDGFFQILGVRPIAGRWFTPQEDIRGNSRVVMLGEGLWRRRYGTDPDILGRQIRVNNLEATMDEYVSASVAAPRFNTILLGVFALLALVLAAVGIFGVISYSVSERTQEIGLRRALGAETGAVMHLVFAQALRLAALGAAIGLGGALGLTRLLQGLLFGVTPTDPLTFAACHSGASPATASISASTPSAPANTLKRRCSIWKRVIPVYSGKRSATAQRAWTSFPISPPMLFVSKALTGNCRLRSGWQSAKTA
jgi:ABC-type antimicrobial peptide transport system permease subunit